MKNSSSKRPASFSAVRRSIMHDPLKASTSAVSFFRKVGHVVPSEHRAARKERRQPGHAKKGDAWRGEGSAAFEGERSVRMQYLASRGAGVRVLVQEADEGNERVFLHDGVWIQHQHIASARLPDRLIIRHAEACIVCIGYEMHFGEMGPHHRWTAVHRVVIDHERLHAQVGLCAEHRAERLFEEIPHIIIDDHDRKVDCAGAAIVCGGGRRGCFHG